MISLRKTFLVLLMLWFPFYTGAAAAMVVCKQTLAAPAESTAGDSAASAHAMHSQHGADDAHHPGDSSAQHNHYTAKDCNQCGLCHVACAPWIGSSMALSFAGEPQQYTLLDLDPFRSNLAPPSSRPPAS